MGQEMNLPWNGTLTIENVPAVAGLIRELLAGKRYTFVACNEFFGFKPEVRTGQTLKPSRGKGDPVNCYGETPDHAGFHINDTYGVWGLSTSQKGGGYDSDFNAPYFVFEWDKVTVTLRAPAWTSPLLGGGG
jgi:hypothetical protein